MTYDRPRFDYGPRYSEDIDLVQINPGPIKPILFRLGEVLGWMPDRVTKPKRYNNTVLLSNFSQIRHFLEKEGNFSLGIDNGDSRNYI